VGFQLSLIGDRLGVRNQGCCPAFNGFYVARFDEFIKFGPADPVPSKEIVNAPVNSLKGLWLALDLPRRLSGWGSLLIHRSLQSKVWLRTTIANADG
jgi:hypothetical protein